MSLKTTNANSDRKQEFHAILITIGIDSTLTTDSTTKIGQNLERLVGTRWETERKSWRRTGSHCYNQISKHQISVTVEFYVLGNLIMQSSALKFGFNYFFFNFIQNYTEVLLLYMTFTNNRQIRCWKKVYIHFIKLTTHTDTWSLNYSVQILFNSFSFQQTIYRV